MKRLINCGSTGSYCRRLCGLSIMFLSNVFNPKNAGLTTPCGFSKNVFSRKRVKGCFFVTFNNVISQIFPENFIKVSKVVQKI